MFIKLELTIRDDDTFRVDVLTTSANGRGGNHTVDFSSYNEPSYIFTVNLSKGEYGNRLDTNTDQTTFAFHTLGNLSSVENIVGRQNVDLTKAISGFDNLSGNGNGNIIDGKGGYDALTGGAGSDIFVCGADYYF